MINTTPMGPGFFIFFQHDESGSSGGNYGKPYRKERPSRILKPLCEYEKEIKALIEDERKKLIAEEEALRKRLAIVKKERLLAVQQDKIRHKQEIELKYLIVTKAIAQVSADLQKIEQRKKTIKLKARIMKDDEEILLLLYG